MKDWPQLRLTKDDLPRHFGERPINIGLICGEPSDKYVDADLDAPEACHLADLFLPPTHMIHGRAGKPRSHWGYRCDPLPESKSFKDINGRCLVELWADKHQIVVPPSTHPNGEVVQWEPGAGPSPAPVHGAILYRQVALLASAVLLTRHWPDEGSRHDAALALSGWLLRHLDADSVSLLIEAVAKHDEELEDRVECVHSSQKAIATGRRVTGAPTLAKLLRGDGEAVLKRVGEWLGCRLNEVIAVPSTLEAGGVADDQSVLAAAAHSDMGNAECMAYLWRDELRYCHTVGKWFKWSDPVWRIDVDGLAKRRAVDMARARQVAARSLTENDAMTKLYSWAFRSESVAKCNDTLELSASLHPFTTTIETYDRSDTLAATQTGVLDLETGVHRQAKPEDYLTMQLGTEYNPSAACPLWLRFLDEAFDGDALLVRYIQKAAGYCLTASTAEHKLFICHGSGANGKSVLLNTLSRLYGDYAATAPFESFDADNQSKHTNDLAALRGRRFVTISESDQDRRLAEAKVKRATSSDPITARFLYKEFFTYYPTFKIWLATNYLPTISGTDEGIWRRVRVIPFRVSFRGHEDRDLERKLKAELPGILNWAVEGLALWRAEGLGDPEAVESATATYKDESDPIASWLLDRMEQSPGSSIGVTPAYENFVAWARETGCQDVPPQKQFSRRLTSKGVSKKKIRNGPKTFDVYEGLSPASREGLPPLHLVG